MQRKKLILWSALGAAMAAALVVHFNETTAASVRNFGMINTPLGRVQLICAVIPWLLFSFYWEAAAKNVAAASSSESKSSRGIHVLLGNLALVLEIVQIRALGRFLPVSYLTIAAGLAVELIGLSIAIWARRSLGRNWSGEVSIKVEHQLIRSGPYRFVRHPIYTGLLAMYAGTAVVSGTWLAVAGFALALFAYFRKLRLEEARLREFFGAQYDSYRRDTWALVPGLI